MNKILKEIIFIVAIVSLSIVLVLNIVFTSHLSEYEVITFKMNSIIYLIRSGII